MFTVEGIRIGYLPTSALGRAAEMVFEPITIFQYYVQDDYIVSDDGVGGPRKLGPHRVSIHETRNLESLKVVRFEWLKPFDVPIGSVHPDVRV
jgi:hypothetical protein